MEFANIQQFDGIEPFREKVWLSTPTMHGEELVYMEQAFKTNWMSTIGENINAIEDGIAQKTGRKYAVALSCGTAALHLAVKLCGEHVYGQARPGHGCLEGKKVFCSDMTFSATVNPVAYEGGEAVFIDTDTTSWNMDPVALDRAFELYPDVRIVVLAHLYGTPSDMCRIREVCDAHGALIVEDAAESFGATINGEQTGKFGDVSILSMNGNKIITGSSGGILLTDSKESADKVRKWSTQSREAAPWYQHEEIGYNYRMSNVIAGVIRGQLPYLDDHIARKKAIYRRYQDGFKDIPVTMNPLGDPANAPNYWLSCILIDPDAMCQTERGEKTALYVNASGKSCPTEILEALAFFNAEGRPIWKPMHMQPIYRMNPFVTVHGNGRACSDAYASEIPQVDIGSDIFTRGLCLPSDIKMTSEEQGKVVEIVRRCFGQ